jgi:hypothetical protein
MKHNNAGVIGKLAVSARTWSPGVWSLGYIPLAASINQWMIDSGIQQTYGWNCGGVDIGSTSRLYRIDYTNDSTTASSRGTLSQSRNSSAAAGNNSYGWVAGGAGGINRIDRIDYANDLGSASVRGPLSAGLGSLFGIGIDAYGWFGSGLAASGLINSSISRVDYNNDTVTATVQNSVLLPRESANAIGNATFGYIGGGLRPLSTAISFIERMEYSQDTSALVIRSPLPNSVYNLFTYGTEINGYWGGGQGANFGEATSTISRLIYSADTSTILNRSSYPSTRYDGASMGSDQYGYSSGGYGTAPSITSRTCSINRLDYSNDTDTAATRGPMPFLIDSQPGVGGRPG